MAEETIIKSCNNLWSQCYYRNMTTAPVGCVYTGYCDHQLPRDSRMQPFIYNYTPGTDDLARFTCICGGSVCSNGVTCSICGKRKY
jgi:hypothetical protein